MVYHGRVELLSHDLSQKYLQMKWNAYGKYIHLSHLVLYLCYLAILTSFASGYLKRDGGVENKWNNITRATTSIGVSGSNVITHGPTTTTTGAAAAVGATPAVFDMNYLDTSQAEPPIDLPGIISNTNGTTTANRPSHHRHATSQPMASSSESSSSSINGSDGVSDT